MSGPAERVEQTFTYADYLTWPEDERWEIIDGQAWDMAPAPGATHQDVVGGLYMQVRTALKGRPCKVYLAPFDVRLPRADEADDRVDTVVQPDLSIFCDRGKIDDRGARGAPDWVIEVLSPHTARKDHTTKRDLYARCGVAEYWLIHPLDRVLTIYRREGEGFGPPSIAAAQGVTRAEALEIDIDWEQVFEAEA